MYYKELGDGWDDDNDDDERPTPFHPSPSGRKLDKLHPLAV